MSASTPSPTLDPPPNTWEPPAKIEELFASTAGNKFAGMNRPTAGARNGTEADVGSAPLQLYSLATPNGQKVGVVLEELGIEYDAWTIAINGNQFNQGFVDVNPNSKIPCAVDHAPKDGGPPIRLFESAAICVYLAEKHGQFLPTDPRTKAECMNWVMWQMAGQGPMTGNFGHFMVGVQFQASPVALNFLFPGVRSRRKSGNKKLWRGPLWHGGSTALRCLGQAPCRPSLPLR
jgi:hypothetical protein